MAYITVYDTSGLSNFLNGLIGISIVVNSVADMVSKVLRETEGQRYKSELFLMGNGWRNYQSVGSPAVVEPSGNRSLQTYGGELIGAGKTLLPRLSSRISVIHLMGLDDENGRSHDLMDEVARALGRGGRARSRNSLVINAGSDSRPVRHSGTRAVPRDGSWLERLGELSGER
jgi:hypothetical protein